MSNNIPTILKTGAGDGSGELNALEKQELETNVTSTVMSFVTYAMETAAVYINHTGRPEITPRDMRRAMMIEVFAFFNRTDLAEKIAECRAVLVDGVDNETDEEEEDDDEEPSTTEIRTCTCEICRHMEIIEDHWSEYVPTDGLGQILKKHIDEIQD